jgi:hypothetical protein
MAVEGGQSKAARRKRIDTLTTAPRALISKPATTVGDRHIKRGSRGISAPNVRFRVMNCLAGHRAGAAGPTSISGRGKQPRIGTSGLWWAALLAVTKSYPIATMINMPPATARASSWPVVKAAMHPSCVSAKAHWLLASRSVTGRDREIGSGGGGRLTRTRNGTGLMPALLQCRFHNAVIS